MKTQKMPREKLISIIEEQDKRIAELEKMVEWFKTQFHLAKHKQYGVSSEKTHLNQMTLFNASETTADSTQEMSKITEVKAHYRKRTRLTTDKLPGFTC